MFKSKGNHLKRCRQSLAYCCVDTLEPVSEQKHLLIYKQLYVNINIIIFFIFFKSVPDITFKHMALLLKHSEQFNFNLKNALSLNVY